LFVQITDWSTIGALPSRGSLQARSPWIPKGVPMLDPHRSARPHEERENSI